MKLRNRNKCQNRNYLIFFDSNKHCRNDDFEKIERIIKIVLQQKIF